METTRPTAVWLAQFSMRRAAITIESTQTDDANLFSGLRVIDAATWIAGPAAATVMSDFGAEVIKIEPPTGDPLRHLAASNPLLAAGEHNHFWVLDSRNKRSLALDLKHPDSREILDELIRSADVFITNFRSGLAARLGLDWERLRVVNPRLIYGQVTGYGDSGPGADQPGYDTTAWWSRTGLADWVRRPGTPPALSAPGMGDHATAMSLFGAISAALWARERTGEGRRVSTSLFANGIWSNGMLTSMKLCGADLPERRQALAVSNALGMQYETADSRWLQLTLLNEDREWPRLLAALKAEHLADDPRFCTTADRREHAPALHGLLVEAFQRFSAQQAKTMLEAAGIPAAMLTAIDDLPEDAQALAADIVTAVAEPRPGGWAQTVNSPIWIDGFPKRPATYAPDLGEHSDEILRELGIDGERLARLREQGVIR